MKTAYQSTTHLHFVAQDAPINQPIIALNTNPKRLVNNICVINKIAPGYAPKGQHLISLSIVGDTSRSDTELISAVRNELQHWFGKATQDWQYLHTRRIEYALPVQSSVIHEISNSHLSPRPGLYICGDFLLNGSINASMKIGKQVGELVCQQV